MGLAVAVLEREPEQVLAVEFLRDAGKYEILYVDGSRREIPLVEAYNVTDLRAAPGVRASPWNFAARPDVLVGSALAWRGPSLSGIPLNLQVITWANPDPTAALYRVVVTARQGGSIVVVGLSIQPTSGARLPVRGGGVESGAKR